MSDVHAAAVLAKLNAALTPEVAYDLDDIPPSRPANYVEITVTRRHGGEERAGGWIGTVGWRITTRWVGRTVTNARNMRDDCFTALEFVPLTVAGLESTPVAFETEEPIGPDGEPATYYTGLATWTFTL